METWDKTINITNAQLLTHVAHRDSYIKIIINNITFYEKILLYYSHGAINTVLMLVC